MRIRDDSGVYSEIEKLLKQSSTPMTCVDLFDHQQIRNHASTPNRVSDYLGHMFRRGLLGREMAPKTPNSQARFAYFWKEPKRPARAAYSAPAAVDDQLVRGKSNVLLDKPSIQISEDGGLVTIELPQLSITIKVKN